MSLRIVCGLIAGAFALGANPALAQDYPVRPIIAIVPFAPGGPVDTITRIVSEHMSRTLGQTIVIENVAGAGGTTGSARAMRAAPDGYTIITGHMGTHAAAVGAYPDLAYDPRTDFEPLALLAGTPTLIYARKDFPAEDLKEFVAYVKANAGKLNNAHAGVGSVAYTTCLLFNHLLGVKPTMIPYNGGARPQRAGRRPGRLHVRPDHQRHGAGPVRPDQGLRDRNPAAPSAVARCSDHDGSRPAGLPGLRLERDVRAQGHAQADPRQTQRRDRQGAR